MFYSVYPMYDEGMQIMVPSHLKLAESVLASQYMWTSKDKKTRINVTRGNVDLDENSLSNRFDFYYRRFSNDIKGFKSNYIKKRSIHTRPYIETTYHSKMGRYNFFNLFMLGIYEERELIFTIQCVEDDTDYNIRVFENIRDSLRVMKKTSAPTVKKPRKDDAVSLELVYVCGEKKFTINVDKDEFTIGRDEDNVDGLILPDISNAISRKHCHITKINNKYFVQDLKSSNRTLINGIMIPPYELMELFDNDILTLADLEFRARINIFIHTN